MFADGGDLAAAAAVAVADVLSAAVLRQATASLVLTGGRTTRQLYRRLAIEHRNDVPWPHVRVYWGDERHVPPGDDRSNYRMARETLLDHVPVRPEHVHRMPAGAGTPAAAAGEYERTLRGHFAGAWPAFDLVLLAVGDDGHMASLFPGAVSLDETTRWVVAATAPAGPRDRLTLTVPALASGTAIFMLATGGAKAEALRCALGPRPDQRCPASLIQTAGERVMWWLDVAAAAHLDPPYWP